MKAKALNQFLDADSKIGGIQGLIRMTLCPTANKFTDRLCIDRQCRNCGIQKLKNELTEKVRTGTVKWDQGVNAEDAAGSGRFRIQKVTETGTVDQCVCELCEELVHLPRHDFNHRWQATQYENITRRIPDGWAIITYNFA